MIPKEDYATVESIEVKVLPFQQTSQPEEFNTGIFSSATFMGMIFVLVPVSLAIDMVYDREVSNNNNNIILSYTINFSICVVRIDTK